MSCPLPSIVPARPSCVSAATLNVPSETKVTARLLVKLDVDASVPPAIVRSPVAAPRLASLDTDSVPMRTSVPPV
ncbi:hypothetical protein D3C85_1893820 [compost metagenome]